MRGAAMRVAAMRVAALFVFIVAAPADANELCEHVEAVADAESALMVAPQLFGTVGYGKLVDDASAVAAPRVTAGLSYDFVGLWEGAATRAKARAECRRHVAAGAVAAASTRGALEARGKVLDSAVRDADQMIDKLAAEVRERVATEQELVTMRLRIDELRRLAAQTQRELAAQPDAGALSTYARADDDVERHSARLRRLRAIDVAVRGGYDRFLDRDDDAPYFAMLTVAVNTGVLFQGGANERARTARSRHVRDRRALDAEVAMQRQRAEQTAALIADLEQQIERIVKLGGDDGRRYQRTLWFDLVKLKAEHAYATAQVASLAEPLAR